VFTESLSSFFRNVDVRTGRDLPIGNGSLPISSLKAHAVLVDTEEGVVNETLAGPISGPMCLFVFALPGTLPADHVCISSDQSINRSDVGAGNNFAHGFHGYGPQYRETVSDMVRRVVERCDAVQSLCLLHSLGGGTGSGIHPLDA
jgi:tubulin epsilon